MDLMSLRPLVPILLLLGISAQPLAAQEPRPVELANAAMFDGNDQIELSYAWRYAPGDEPGRESPAYDDSRWIAVEPALKAPGRVGWTGVGWFRRHLKVGPGLQTTALALRFTAPGTARVYLDGRLVLRVGDGGTPPEIPGPRSDAALIRLAGPSHVLTVRYAYPPDAPRTGAGIGFLLALSNRPGAPPQPPPSWTVALRGAVLALPILLALLHLALFSFDRRARENLFYALEMLTFAGIVLREYRDVLLTSDAQRELAGQLDRIGRGLPIIAILFSALTYYALRTRPWPKSWRIFLVAGIVLYPLSYFLGRFAEYLWMAYFLALVADILRLESGKGVVQRKGARFYLVSFAVFGVTVALQAPVSLGLLESVAGVREVYVLGILASAVGMSLYLASTLGQSRVDAAENERKTRELTQARELQLSMLPGAMPRLPGLDIAATTQTAAEVGGDYYDVRLAGDGTLLFAFGDATGHGLSAGIVVTAAKALFTALPPTESPRALLASCDRALAGMHLPTLRMCLSLALLSPRSITVASAAMPPLLLCHAATGEVEELGAGGLPLGGRMAGRYEERTSGLADGDTLLFASDGFAELTDPYGKQLGYDGAAAAFRRAAQARTAQEIIERLLAEAAVFRSTHPQEDDITFVAVRVSP
jgi:hypothetical protein